MPSKSLLLAAGMLLATTACPRESVDAAAVASGMKEKMKLPMQVDETTRLDDVRATGKKELGYFLTLTTLTKAELDANAPLVNQLETGIRGGACTNPDYMKIVRAGISVRITYSSKDQIEVRTIRIGPKDCGL